MSKRVKIVLAAMVVILLTVSVLLLPTFALFSDTVGTEHYIQSGSLRIDLYETHMAGNQIGADGTFSAYPDIEEEIDLSTYTGKVFEIYGIVPGVYRTGTFEVRDAGSTAAYDLSISLTDIEVSAGGSVLAEQIRITIAADNAGDSPVRESFTLAEAEEAGAVSLGRMLLTQKVKEFTVTAEFINTSENNAAQNAAVSFGMLVTAMQVTP